MSFLFNFFLCSPYIIFSVSPLSSVFLFYSWVMKKGGIAVLLTNLNIIEKTGWGYIYILLDILFCQIATFIKVRMTFVIRLQTLLKLIDIFYFTKIFLSSLKPKNKGHTNFYECCDLTKKVYLAKHTKNVTAAVV